MYGAANIPGSMMDITGTEQVDETSRGQLVNALGKFEKIVEVAMTIKDFKIQKFLMFVIQGNDHVLMNKLINWEET